MIQFSFVLALLATAPESADTAVNDARLNDVCFVDARHGWVVGDRGAIWNTDDGGRNWRLQTSGTSGPLWTVWFHDAQLGWAAGGSTNPYTYTSTGVLLTTRDGGKTWTANPRLGLPTLRRLRFFNAQHGWAVGCPSAMYPTGVFATDDGGRHWRPLPGGAASDWLAADFLAPHSGALAGRRESLAVARGGQIEMIQSEPFALRGLTQIQLVAPVHGWLVGEGGVVRISNDLGNNWQPPTGPPPQAVGQFDFSALAVRGPKCWIAGSPGTRVLHTADAGRSWKLFTTGSTVPLRAISFVDDQHGWAVGQLGTILATDDGGRNWQRQRAGGEQAALLGLLAESDDAPLELIARLAGNEGYLTVVDVVGRRDVEIPPRDDVHLSDRLHEAVVRVGGCAAETAWRFPLRQPGLRWTARQIIDAWDRVGNGRGEEELQAYLVRQIRIWRPEVIVSHDAPRNNAPLISIVHRAVLKAVDQAADRNAFPKQIVDAGLEPWTVKRVFGAMPPGTRTADDLATSQFAPRLGCSLAEAAAEPRGLLQNRPATAPSTLGFRLLQSTAPQERDRRDFFGGIAMAPGGPARRTLSSAIGEAIDVRQRIAQQRRHVQAILENAGRAAGSIEQLLAQVDQLTRDLDESSRGQILYQLADRYDRTGHWPLAAETFEVLVERYPQHALAPQAMLWLVQYYASGEAAWRVERRDARNRLELAIAMGQQIERTRPDLFAKPELCFPLAAAYRGLDQSHQAIRFYRTQIYGSDRGDWSVCAQGELHLTDPSAKVDNAKGRSAKPMLVCASALSKPRLDGLLDDPVWRQAKPAALQSAQHDDGDWPAAVMLAYDDEFLYIAAHCREPAGSEASPADAPASPRPRDADLSAYDRIELLLDIDRDFATYYRLAVDRRGWTNDACWNDGTWNPKWFVAAKRGRGAWTIEAAIPRAELIGGAPKPGDTWAVGVQRVVPGVGIQSWSTPAAVAVLPDGFGYMVFR